MLLKSKVLVSISSTLDLNSVRKRFQFFLLEWFILSVFGDFQLKLLVCHAERLKEPVDLVG